MEIINDGQWISGQDSISYTLAQGSYAWGQNVVNRGGILETRQGVAEIAAIAQRDPRGLAQITIANVTWLIAAIGNFIYKLNLNDPSAGLVKINNLSCPAYTEPIPPNPAPPIPVSRRMVHFELCVQAQRSVKVTDPITHDVGYTTKQLDTPKFVIIIQDGVNPAQFWDPVETQQNKMAGRVDNHPDYIQTRPNNTPTGSFMRWVGDRLWLVQGKKVRASNLLNPFQFTEELVTASGGAFYLPDNGTGMGVTHDYKALLVFTHFTTTAFQVGIEDRAQWPQTQDFQRVIFPSIGCASHRSIVNMYGMTWWMSHDGVVGLDNAMASYQTTKLDIKDLNMIRSKQGINWATGGGAAGSFGNFLFFSVPSASKWNQHTWVMDQAPLQGLAGTSPPSWCANWTGIRPEQWVTCTVGGQQRCFFISRDLTNEGHQSTVWEGFIGQRMDVPKVGVLRKARDIGCAFESRFMGLSPSQYAKLRWIELDVAEIIGNVLLKVYYCGRRTSYKLIADTFLTSTVSNTTEEIFNPDDPIPVYVPQYRTVRSVTDVHEEDDKDSEVQTPYLRNKDREFSVLVMWIGQMSVSGLRLAVDPEPDYMEGTDYPDEFLQKRVITAEGEGHIETTLTQSFNSPNGQLTSKFLSPTKPRWVEFPAYDSAVPNGVFFVAELQATPPAQDYPINLFPITVTLTSETQGIDIYYTLNGQVPHGPPNPVGTLYDAAHHPSVALNQTLKAVGVRSGLSPSILLQGHYTQSKVADVIFTPPPGGFPPEEFRVDAPPYTGPVVAYNFNKGTGTIAADSSPNNVDATIIDATWNTAGQHGKALDFNGSTGRVWIANPSPTVHPELNFSGSMTLSAWVYVSALAPSGGQNVIVGRTDGHKGWSIYMDSNNRACVSVASASNVFAVRTSTHITLLNTWTHITGIYTAGVGTLDIYYNGVLDNGTLTGTVPTGPQAISPSVVQVGARGDLVGYFHGAIDDVRVYSRTINQTEITADMNTGIPDSTVPPVQAGFPVLMTCATPLAAIHFITSDAPRDVRTTDPLYNPGDPPHPYAGDTLRAKAFKTYYLDSDQTNGRYFAKPRCATPTCTPDEGAYENGDYPKAVTVASATAGSILRVTINDPDVINSPTKANPAHINVNADDTVRAIAQKEGLSDSHLKQATYTVRPDSVATPVLHPAVRVLHNNVHDLFVTITCSTPNVHLRWRVGAHGDLTPPVVGSDGTNVILEIPEDGAIIHLGPAQPGHIGHKTLRVIAYREDMTDSVMVNGVYDYGD